MSVQRIAVVVPARDEEELLPGCLASIAAAIDSIAAAAVPGPTIDVLVVADGCTDGTAEVARRAGAEVLIGPGGTVGAARHAGALLALRRALAAGTPPERTWLASTDADSTVPADWLARQLAAAEAGIDAVLGTVAVTDWSGHPRHVAQAFHRDYDAWRSTGGEHPHIHGANLGVRGSTYRAVGGFPALAVGEDVALAAALQAAGVPLLRTAASPVTTSSRRTPRALGGFGTDLDELNELAESG